jgi:uncharacterized protein (DUF2336 family)
MIVRQFLQWIRTASAGERAEATSALARAYLYSELSSDDRSAVEGAMLILLDDTSPLVRRALAEALAASPNAPPAVIHALASDQPEIAAIVIDRSPLFIDADLVDLAAIGVADVQAAIARRAPLPRSVAAALAEVGCVDACLTLLDNPSADIAAFSIDRIVARFGHVAAVRDLLFGRADLPPATRQALIAKLSSALADLVVSRDWLDAERARRAAVDACEKATVAMAAEGPADDVRPLVKHLRATGQLTAGLVLRALLSGNMRMFEEALAELADLPLARVRALLHDRGMTGVRAIFDQAGLPASSWPAFREATVAMRESAHLDEPGGASRLKRRMIERVLTGCGQGGVGEVEPLLTLLRRFATEAAREEARLYCQELVEDDFTDPLDERVAA